MLMDKNAMAWMLRKDGKEIPVETLVYADSKNIDDLLALAYFLWKHNWTHEQLRTDPGDYGREELYVFLDAWSYLTCAGKTKSRIFVKEEVADAIIEYLSTKPYQVFPESFAEIIAIRYSSLLRKRGKGDDFHPLHRSTWSYRALAYDTLFKLQDWYGITRLDSRGLCVAGAWLVNHVLEPLFIRARYGGMHDSIKGCRDMYFLISKIDPYDWLLTTEKIDKRTTYVYRKKNFDWFPVIRAFVEARVGIVDTVTITRDIKTTLSEDVFVDSNKRPYSKMPIQEFLAGSGSIKIENTIPNYHALHTSS